MEEVKFTPGPWLADDVATVRDSNGYEICNTLRSPLYDDLSANEYLIASAPELYARVLQYRDVMEDKGCHSTVERLDELLSKARGEL
ncbi:hypothetical protein LMG33818_000001 [Halomonadaceae bacterium LMG 33818]|uniref:hypothetical protein n=1 Tax=Cernens ardua TaxID=3402176 RepID=UPI003EDBA908